MFKKDEEQSQLLRNEMQQGIDIRVYAYGSYGHLKIKNFPSFVYEPKRKDFQE